MKTTVIGVSFLFVLGTAWATPAPICTTCLRHQSPPAAGATSSSHQLQRYSLACATMPARTGL